MTRTHTLMAVHAHPDDESSSTGGVLARYGDEGAQTIVVTCTNGEMGDGPGHVKPGEPGHDPDAVAATRLAELDIACHELGVTHSLRLGYRDSGMEEWEFRHHPDAFCNVPIDIGAARLLELFETYRPDVVVTYSDAGGYNHPDHLQAHRITVAAVGQSDIPAKLYLIARRRRDWQAMRARIEALGLEFPQLPEPSPERLAQMAKLEALITTTVDVRPVVDRKRAALVAHTSQLDESWWSRIPPDVWSEVFGEESFIRVRDTTRAPVPETDLFAGVDGIPSNLVPEFFVPPLVADSAMHSGNPVGPAWLRDLPARVARLAERWELDLDAPFVPGGLASYTAPARRADGSGAVLKVVLPHREARDEAAALRVWAGDGAVVLLDDAPEEHALLLERCIPGTPLTDLEDRDAILDIGADVLARLWPAPVPDEPFESLAAVTDWFADVVAARQVEFGRPLPDRLVDEALVALRDLPRTATARAVLHHDFHPGNVLAAQRQAWLAIDPKPQVGDPAFDPLQLILQTSDPLDDDDPTATIRYRLARVPNGSVSTVNECGRGAWRVASSGRCTAASSATCRAAEDNAEYARIFSAIG